MEEKKRERFYTVLNEEVAINRELINYMEWDVIDRGFIIHGVHPLAISNKFIVEYTRNNKDSYGPLYGKDYAYFRPLYVPGHMQHLLSTLEDDILVTVKKDDDETYSCHLKEENGNYNETISGFKMETQAITFALYVYSSRDEDWIKLKERIDENNRIQDEYKKSQKKTIKTKKSKTRN